MEGDASAAGARIASKEASVDSISLLMPVWGYRFVGRFLEFCLPTLLAPNNLPALVRELPCHFILLSSESDVSVIQSHPTWQKLAQICNAEIRLIDDLITESNHTATITLAFERALRQAGDAIRNTCFFFLMSDYIIADGSLQTVLATVRNGARGVLVGNFQVTAEDSTPLLRSTIDPASSEIVLKPRELMKWSLGRLHSATIANVVNIGLTHNAHTNRLFWRADENTLVGRFYLMHAIAIHPEVQDFVVGSSWDYSFIPELCPSGSVSTLTDSDDYLVVELQPRGYESDNLRPGPITPTELARGLSEWSTARQRANVEQALVFHAEGKPATLTAAIAESSAFVNEVRSLLLVPPLPHRNHPYWVGSAAVSRFRSNRPLGKEDWNYLLSDPGVIPPSRGWFERLRARLFGSHPAITRLHPCWPDYALAIKALNNSLSTGERALLVADDPRAFAQWAARESGDVFTLSYDQLLNLPHHGYLPLVGTFDCCLLVASELRLASLDEFLIRAFPLLQKNGRIDILIVNQRKGDTALGFVQAFVREVSRVMQQNPGILDVYYVPSSRYRWSLRARAQSLLDAATIGSPIGLPLVLAEALPLTLAVYLANLRTKAVRTPRPLEIYSSVFLSLRRPERVAQPLLRFENDQIAAHTALLAQMPASGLEADQERSAKSESRHEISRFEGNDAEQFAATMARYRFVATLIEGRHDVAEFSCAHPSGTRLVMQDVKRLAIYEPRLDVASDLQRRLDSDPKCEVHIHNILESPLPKQHDSIYSIDFIKYLSPDEERVFLRNLRDSLGREFDFLIIGAPSFYAATRAEAQLAAKLSHATTCQGWENRTYWRTAEQLRELMHGYFHSVFMFSMIDDVVRPGIVRNAEFSFALGCSKH